MMHPKKETLIPLKDIIATILQDPALPFRPDDAMIFQVWEEVVGPMIAGNAKPLWIKKGRLRVKVMTSIWLQELRYQERDILERLNQRLGRQAVKKIEFRSLGE